jgi:hypothetical protein
MSRPFQRGDHVRHKPSGEEWILKRAREGYVEPAGWPPSRAQAEDCELIESVEDQRARGARIITDETDQREAQQKEFAGWIVTPLHIRLMIACYTSPAPWDQLGRHVWESDAGKLYRAHLRDSGLVGDNWRATRRGEEWLRRMMATPLPPSGEES